MSHFSVNNSTLAGLLAGALALASPSAPAGPAHPLDDIAQTAVAYAESQADRFPVPPVVTPGHIDARLRLAHCEVPLNAFESPSGLRAGNTVVGVACEGQQPWKLFVPVRIELPAQVIALNRPLRRGDTLTDDMLTTREADLAKLRGQYFLDKQGLAGQRLRRHVRANVVLTASMIAADRLVERGSRVTIVSDAGGIEVRVAGKALRHGGRGDQIQVRNLASGRTITATVVDQGTVRAGP